MCVLYLYLVLVPGWSWNTAGNCVALPRPGLRTAIAIAIADCGALLE
jgi:hypothetical protein